MVIVFLIFHFFFHRVTLQFYKKNSNFHTSCETNSLSCKNSNSPSPLLSKIGILICNRKQYQTKLIKKLIFFSTRNHFSLQKNSLVRQSICARISTHQSYPCSLGHKKKKFPVILILKSHILYANVNFFF